MQSNSKLQQPQRPESHKFNRNHPTLTWIRLRYHPPGLILEYVDVAGKTKEKTLDLLDLCFGSDTSKICSEILKSEPLFASQKHKAKLLNSLDRLKEKCHHDYVNRYVSLTVFKPHSLPLTDACISKDGKKCVTCSLGNACKLWCTKTGNELGTFIGHKDAVVSVQFNPMGDRILTGSHDGTIRQWSCGDDGIIQCDQILNASDTGRVLFAKYSPDYQMAVSATDDDMACVHDMINGVTMYKFSQEDQERKEITSVNLDKAGTLLLASPHGNDAALWDLRSGELSTKLRGHEMEITKSIFDFSSQTIATSSLDSRVKIWDLRMLNDPLYTFHESESEIFDMEFDSRGKRLAAGNSDGTLMLWEVPSGKLLFERKAHKSSITKVGWSPNGAIVMSCSDSGTIRLFHGELGSCLQTIPDHSRDIVNASFNYSSEFLLTASKDKTVRIHRQASELKTIN